MTMKKYIKAEGIDYTFEYESEYEDKGIIYVIGKYPICPKHLRHDHEVGSVYFRKFKKNEVTMFRVIKFLGFTFKF